MPTIPFRGSSPENNVWNDIHWWILGPCLGAVVVGLVLLAFPITEATRFFVSGALVGIGAGGGIAEFSAAFERLELRGELGQLREPIRAQCRFAYKIGEFIFPFYAAISKRQYTDRHVKQVLFLAELLGIRATLESAIHDANPDDPELHELLTNQIKEAMVYVGQHLILFFDLASDLLALRSSAAKTDLAARAVVARRVGINLNRARAFTDDSGIVESWMHLAVLWDREVLTSDEVDDLLLSFHAFLTGLGLEYEGFLPWKAIIDDLAKLDVGKTGRPADLMQVLDAIRRARS